MPFGGDVKEVFTLQSISKVLALALVLMEHGPEKVFHFVGKEPTGDPFNSIIKLETVNPGKPLNPMINAGALVVTSMMKGATSSDRIGRLLEFVRALANNRSISFAKRSRIRNFKRRWSTGRCAIT